MLSQRSLGAVPDQAEVSAARNLGAVLRGHGFGRHEVDLLAATHLHVRSTRHSGRRFRHRADGKPQARVEVDCFVDVTPDITEDWKWDTGVWVHGGMVCAVGSFKDHVELNFFQGAALDDPKKLLNAGLDAKKTRAIDFYEHDAIDEAAPAGTRWCRICPVG